MKYKIINKELNNSKIVVRGATLSECQDTAIALMRNMNWVLKDCRIKVTVNFNMLTEQLHK